jgi:Fur family ferric uptake transcriptional regulator
MTQRSTRQREVIRDVFRTSDRPLSTQEVLHAAQVHKPGLGIATVYRTIKLLSAAGWIDTVRLPGLPPRYELAGRPHHHHFYCNHCGRAFEVPGSQPLLDALVPSGFVLEHHDLVLYGRCATCALATA